MRQSRATEASRVPDPSRPRVLSGVTFQAGGSALTSISYQILDDVAASLVARSDVRIEIAGHTDWTGSPGANRILSQSRAESVMAYLESRGVSPARMIARGYGADSPIASNRTAYGREQNRRVEVRVLPNQ